jgi:hypothetical protein
MSNLSLQKQYNDFKIIERDFVIIKRTKVLKTTGAVYENTRDDIEEALLASANLFKKKYNHLLRIKKLITHIDDTERSLGKCYKRFLGLIEEVEVTDVTKTTWKNNLDKEYEKAFDRAYPDSAIANIA